MTAYWTGHEQEIIVWSIVGIFLLLYLIWCFRSKAAVNIQPLTPPLLPQPYPAIYNFEFAPLPRVFLPLPLYEERERDLWLPDHTELVRRDGFHYPKGLSETGRAVELSI